MERIIWSAFNRAQPPEVSGCGNLSEYPRRSPFVQYGQAIVHRMMIMAVMLSFAPRCKAFRTSNFESVVAACFTGRPFLTDAARILCTPLHTVSTINWSDITSVNPSLASTTNRSSGSSCTDLQDGRAIMPVWCPRQFTFSCSSPRA